MLKNFLSYRSHEFALFLLLAVSLLCTQIPLFNYLGYEFSAVIALLASFLAGLLTISLWRKSEASSRGDVVSFSARSSAVLLLSLVIPVIVISANAFFVKNCSFPNGILLFLLIPVPAVLFAHALALLLSVTLNGWRKTWFVLLWLLILAQIVYVTMVRPQIFAFNPVIGFFPGLTYDETLNVIPRLLLYRAGTLAFSISLVLLAVLVDQWKARRRSGGAVSHSSGPKAISMLVLLAFSGVLFIFSDRLGLSSSEDSIRRELGGEVETEHFVVVYPDSMLKGVRLSQIVQLHEFYFDQLSRALRLRPERKIHSFLYASAEQKGRLVGAARTDISKPWLWQIHINLSDVDASLKHELSHVLAGEFGFPILRVGVNSGLIEGFATAVEGERYGESLHRLSAMIYAAGLRPDMESLFSFSGFLRAQPDVSYTLAGSFCRFLIERYGLRRFKMVYRSGNFTYLYGRNLTRLLVEWRRSLEQYRLSDADLEKAAYFFKRPSIFGKECARVIANLNARTRELYSEGQYQQAVESSTRSLSLTTSVEAIFQRTNSLFKLQRYQEAIAFAREKLSDSTVNASLLPLRLVLGDALWGADSLDAAASSYEHILRADLSPSWDEGLTIRLSALRGANLVRDLKPYFTTPMADSERVVSLEQVAQRRSKDPLPRYMLARELASQEQYESAIDLLLNLPKMNPMVLERFRQQRIARAYFALGRYRKAQIYYWQSLNDVTNETESAAIEERVRFCEWLERHSEGPH
jgi:tetratricopeptide (TPR) repeat protein